MTENAVNAAITEDQAGVAAPLPPPTSRRLKRAKDKPLAGDTNSAITSAEPTLTIGDVARLYGVDPKTVTRWVRAGRMPEKSVITTPGGHRRIREAAILKLINDGLQ